MKTIATDIRSAAVISSVLVLPLVILELVFNAAPTARNVLDQTALFGLLWLLPTAFVAGLWPVVRNARASTPMTAKPVNLLLRVFFLAVVAVAWGSLLADQIPCFIGVPNCD